ncbi:MAG: hypothetical protein KAR21_20270 [Spirochaetales bacterium]|nr:hypothetical protein [Spirochaetales bacterium]
MTKRFFLLIIIFSFFSFSVSAVRNDQGPDTLLAGIYLKHAVDQFNSDNFLEAFSLADISLMFLDTSSDALFIRGISSRKSEVKDSSIADLSTAIISDNWKYYNETTARVFLSEYMYLEGDIESAYINLLPFSNDLANSSFSTEMFIRMSISLGKVEEAVKAAGNLLRVDPSDSYSQLIMALYDPEWRLRAEQILIEGDPANSFSKDVVQIIIESSIDCFFLMNLYRNRWGEDRFYKISNICNGNDTLKELLDELYPENSVIEQKELIRVYSLVKDDASRLLIDEQLGSIKLTVIYDNDNDGFSDTEALFNMGNLVSFSFDSNQDNNYDYFVELNELPVSLKIKNGEEILSFFYETYPNLINVTVSDKKSLTEYKLIPYTLVLDIIKLPLNPVKGIPHILDNITFPDSDILTVSSTEKSINNFTSSLDSKYIWIESDESVESIFDSDGIRVIERHFRNFVLITVFKDFDSDGVFDTTYEYKDGLLQTISFDANNNSIPEYVEDYTKGLVRIWDFNEDGIPDSRERYENGIIFRELSISSELNGNLETFIEIKGDID